MTRSDLGATEDAPGVSQGEAGSTPESSTVAAEYAVGEGGFERQRAPRERSGSGRSIEGSSRSRRSGDLLPVGVRTRRRQLEAERRFKIGAVAGFGVLGFALAVALVFRLLGGGSGGGGELAGRMASTDRTLLVAVAPEGPGKEADSIVLFGLVGESRASAVAIPSGTTTDVPVHGPATLGESASFGGPDLLELSTENLLGVRVDSTVILDRQGFIDAIAPLAPFDILVEERLGVRDGNEIVTRFQPGRYSMDASTLNAYMELRAEGESEMARLARHQKVWEAVIERARALQEVQLVLEPDGVHVAANAPVSTAAEVISALRSREVAFSLLPVDPKQSLEGEESFEPRQGDIQRVVSQMFPGAAVAPDVEARIRIGILNGNGGVGVSEAVARQLVPLGYRVVYTENADRFDYPETQIVFYRTPDERFARDIRAALGRGRLVFNRETQDVVDILIVVGHDFPAEQGSVGNEGQAAP